MKKKFTWLILSCLVVFAMLLASCTTSTPTATLTTKSITIPTTVPTMSATTAITTTPTTTITGKWWDKLGQPQYGGQIVLRMNRDFVLFDPDTPSATTMESTWFEKLFTDDWTLDPAIYDYKIAFRSSEYQKGQLAESWEFTEPGTFVVHLRKGIHWQDIPPLNGREFTADDIAYHFHRMYGLGSGFTKPLPHRAAANEAKYLISVTATDKYTVVFKWRTSSPEFILETMQAQSGIYLDIEAREAVEKWGNLNDWHHAIGTGPFILTDFVSSTSATLIKNPNYWGYDERHPQNKLPYIDTLKYLIIPDNATALAGLRTGKIDILDGLSIQNSQLLQKSNPEILQKSVPITNSVSLDPRNDTVPFNDIRVRKAMQMAIDLPTIAKSYYGGTAEPYPSSLTSRYNKGWGWPYTEWPQDLKDWYAYNPTAAKKLLTDAGYPKGFKTNVVVDAAADLDLLQIVKSYFLDIGIDMEIRVMESASWTAFVQPAHKHDQMAQKVTGNLGVGFEPSMQFNWFLTGGASNLAMVSDPVFDAFYPKAMTAASVDDFKKIVRDMNEYVARQHFVISLLQPNLFSVWQPWLKGFSGQDQSVGGSNTGPHLNGFYMARFWIDQNLKKSTGH